MSTEDLQESPTIVRLTRSIELSYDTAKPDNENRMATIDVGAMERYHVALAHYWHALGVELHDFTNNDPDVAMLRQSGRWQLLGSEVEVQGSRRFTGSILTQRWTLVVRMGKTS